MKKSLQWFSLSITVLLVTSAIVLAQPQPAQFSVGGFEFERPEGFEWIPPSSPMRKAELRVKNQTDSDAVEVLFFHFGPGQGGGIEANISRWLGQFEEPIEKLEAERAEQIVGSTKVTFLRAKGTYLSGMPGQTPTPKPGYALAAAILSSEIGDVYVKMTGPQIGVELARSSFERMVLDAARRGIKK